VRYQQAAIVAGELSKFVAPAELNKPLAQPTTTLSNYEESIGKKRGPSESANSAKSSESVTISQENSASGGGKTPLIKLDDQDQGQISAKLRSRSSKKSSKVALVFTVLGILAIGGVIVGFSMFKEDEPVVNIDGENHEVQVENLVPKQGTNNTNNNVTNHVPEVTGRQVVVNDDGRLLWASPTEGQSIVLDYVPIGAQVFMIVRPAEMLASDEGERVLEALGPSFAAARAGWEKASGVLFQEIQQLIVGLYDNEGKIPRPAFVVRLNEAIEKDELLARWNNPELKLHDDKQYYSARGWSFYIPKGTKNVFVMGNEQEIKEVLDFNGAPPTVRREIANLLDTADDQRHYTLIFAPKYLFGDGRDLLSGNRSRVIEPLFWFMGDNLQAGLLSMHFSDHFFVELRTIGSLDLNKKKLSDELSGRLNQIPEKIESYVVAMDPHPYWKRLALRYPQMIRLLHANARSGVEDDQVVINSVLHLSAAHNIVYGTELVIAQAPGAALAVADAPTGPKNVEEALNRKMDLSFDQTSLEFAMRDIAADVNENFKLPFEFKIKIIGDDLKLDGITRNQQVRDFNQMGKTVAEILTALVMKANPVTTVKEPNEKDQKLLWVIQPDPDVAGRNMVLITTRQVSEKKKYNLPPPFQLK